MTRGHECCKIAFGDGYTLDEPTPRPAVVATAKGQVQTHAVQHRPPE